MAGVPSGNISRATSSQGIWQRLAITLSIQEGEQAVCIHWEMFQVSSLFFTGYAFEQAERRPRPPEDLES